MKDIQANMGMSLIELMVVLIIVAILATMALPQYQTHLQSSRRMAGKLTLQQLMLRQEQHRLVHNEYGTIDEIGVPDSEYYSYLAVNIGVNTYTLVAKAKGQQSEDEQCKTLSINQSMQKAPETCW